MNDVVKTKEELALEKEVTKQAKEEKRLQAQKEREEKAALKLAEKEKANQEKAEKREAEKQAKADEKAAKAETARLEKEAKLAEGSEAKEADKLAKAQAKADAKAADKLAKDAAKELAKAEKVKEKEAAAEQKKADAEAKKQERLDLIASRKQALADRAAAQKVEGSRRPKATHFTFTGAGLSTPQALSTRGKVYAALVAMKAEADEAGDVLPLISIDEFGEQLKGILYGTSVRGYLSKLEAMGHLEFESITTPVPAEPEADKVDPENELDAALVQPEAESTEEGEE